jgi:hypothetical protein
MQFSYPVFRELLTYVVFVKVEKTFMLMLCLNLPTVNMRVQVTNQWQHIVHMGTNLWISWLSQAIQSFSRIILLHGVKQQFFI